MMDQGKNNLLQVHGRTKPFLRSGKCLDFIGTMFTLIVIMSTIGQLMIDLYEHNFLVIVIILMLSMLSIILLILVGFYIYHGITGLPVDLDQDQSIQFPPARLKIKDVVIITINLAMDVAVFAEGLALVQKGTFNSFDFLQISLAAVAFVILLAALSQLYTEHQIWKNSNQF